MGTLKLLAPCRRVIVLIEPICDLLVVPPLLTILAYRVVEKLLILRIGCDPQIGETTSNSESKKDVGGVILGGYLAPVSYTHLTLPTILLV